MRAVYPNRLDYNGMDTVYVEILFLIMLATAESNDLKMLAQSLMQDRRCFNDIKNNENRCIVRIVIKKQVNN